MAAGCWSVIARIWLWFGRFRRALDGSSIRMRLRCNLRVCADVVPHAGLHAGWHERHRSNGWSSGALYRYRRALRMIINITRGAAIGATSSGTGNKPASRPI
jgi:hypothetical protein